MLTVTLPPGVMVDVLAETGYTKNDLLVISPVSGDICNLYDSDSEPSSPSDHYTIGDENNPCTTKPPLKGLWAACRQGGAIYVSRPNDTGFEVVGGPNQAIWSLGDSFQKTAFGATVFAELKPIAQNLWLHGIRSNAFIFNELDGASYVTGGMLNVSSGSQAGSASNAFLRRFGVYRAGQSLVGIFSCAFGIPRVGNRQIGGLVSALDTLAFGYSSSGDFCIQYDNGGTQEFQELTFTTGATGSESATITIDGIPYSVPITAGTPEHNAYQAALYLDDNIGSFAVSSNGSIVSAVSEDTGDFGAFAFSSATAEASWEQLVDSTEPTEVIIKQDDWNNSTAPWLDHQAGNVYQIVFGYLGFSDIYFSIKRPGTRGFELVHTLRIANERSSPSVSNPNLRVALVSENETAGSPVVIRSASCGLFTEGEVFSSIDPVTENGSRGGVGSTLTNIIALRNKYHLNNQENRIDTKFIQLSGYTDSTKGAILEIRKNPLFSGDLIFTDAGGGSSITEVARDGVTVSDGEVLFSKPVGTSGDVIDLSTLNIVLSPRDIMSICMRTSDGGPESLMVASLNIVENF